MKKESKKILSLFLLNIFIISLFGIIVSADNSLDLSGSFESLFSSWSAGDIGVNLAKIIFFVMVSLLIYLSIGFIFPEKGSKVIVIILSFLVGFLATAYIAPKEIFSLLNSYTALGLTLITLVPLLILGGFTYRAATTTGDKGGLQLIMMQWFAWILFALYSIYRFVFDWFWGKEGSGAVNGILLGTALAATGMAIFNKQILNMISRKFIEAHTDEAGKMLKEVWAIRKAERDSARSATGASK